MEHDQTHAATPAIRARALHDIIIVKPEQESTIIDLSNRKGHIGRVLAVGPGETRESLTTGKKVFVPNELEPGDRIAFSFRAGMEDKIDGVQVLIMREKDVLCVLDDDAHIGLTENRNAWDM